MSNEVYANTMAVSCKSASGKTICATPDVCFTPPQTPATPPGVPIPYPNTGMASDGTDGSSTVRISGKEAMLKNKSCFSKSSGDEAGCAPKKGVVTSKNTGKVYFNMWSMDVKMEGENVVRHLDITTHNHASSMPGNSPPMPYTDAMAPSGGSDDGEACPICPGAGSPVNPVLGMKFLAGPEDLDLTLLGPLPLAWQRTYSSSNLRVGWFGQGWRSPLEATLEAVPDTTGLYVDEMAFIDAFGRRIGFPPLERGGRHFAASEKIVLARAIDGGYSVHNVDGVILRFDAQRQGRHHRLIAMADLNDNEIRLAYPEQEAIHGAASTIHVQGSGGLQVELTFDGPRLIEIDELRATASGTGRVALMRYRYTKELDLAMVVNRAGECIRRFQYNDDHLMVRQTHAESFEAWYEYGDKDRASGIRKVIRHADNVGRTWTFNHGPEETVVTDQDGRVTRYHFDARRRWTGFTDAQGQLTSRGLDQHGNLRAITDPAGNTIEWSYDERGNPVALRNAEGAVTTVEWHDHFPAQTAIIDPLGRKTRFAYDERGNMIAMTDPAGAMTSFEVDERGLPTAIHDAHGGIKRLRHNRQGQLVQYTDCSHKTTRLEYDADHRLACIIDGLGQQTMLSYDAAGRLACHMLPDGSFETYGYDIAGRLTRVTNALGATKEFCYTPDGLVAQRIDEAGNSLRYRYDTGRRLTELANENGAAYHMAYDALDRLIEETRFDLTRSQYHYDPAGLLVQTTQAPDCPEQIVTHFRRDATGRVLERTCGRISTTFEYDKAGQLVRAFDHHTNVELRLRHDAAGRLAGESVVSGTYRHALEHAFDLLGNRLGTMLGDGTQLAHLHYGSGHVHQIRVDDMPIVDFERDALHREISRTQGGLLSHRQYDAAGRLQRHFTTSVQVPTAAAQNVQSVALPTHGLAQSDQLAALRVLIDRRYDYDRAGRLIGALDRGQNHVFEYDALDRLTRFDEERFSFDPAHNLIDVAGARVLNNRITAYRDRKYRYDAHGRMVEKRVGAHTHIELEWDDEHRLVMSRSHGAQGVQETQYLYDPLGRRISKRNANATTVFVWDADRLIQQRRGAERRTFIYEPGRFVPLAQVIKTEPGAELVDGGKSLRPRTCIEYFHCDRIGVPRELTDEAGGIVWEGRYRAWGRLESQTGTSTQPLRFQGQYEDDETGFHYNRHRYYDPDVAVYLSRDPAGFVGGWNSYHYAPNPTAYIDPTGLARVKGRLVVYRQLNARDVERLDAGESLMPAGCGGTIAGHVEGSESDGYLSASETPEGTERYASGNGMVAIDVALAIAGGATFINHDSVLQAVRKNGTLTDVSNVRDTQEVLFEGDIPNNAVTRCGKPKTRSRGSGRRR